MEDHPFLKKAPKPDWVTEPVNINFKSVHPLKEISQKIIDKLSGEEDKVGNFHFLLRNIVVLNLQNYKAVCELAKDSQQGKFALQASFMSRSVLDGLFNVFLLLEDPIPNSEWFEKAGYREARQDLERDQEYYEDKPQAQGFIESQEKMVESMADFLKISKEEIENPKLIKYWPTPGMMIRMVKDKKIAMPSEKVEFLKELEKWHYGQLSGWSHGQWSALAMAVFASMPEEHWEPGKFDSNAAYFGMLYLLMLLSEIDGYKKYGLNKELSKVWLKIAGGYDEAKEYYELRYRNLLNY